MIVLLDNDELLPSAWRRTATPGTVRAFNPGLLRDGSGWLLAYRIVAEPGLERRIAFCRLDESFRVIPGSAFAFSDQVRFPPTHEYPPQVTSWFADPRLYRLAGRLFVYWNSGWHEPQNHQFLQQFDAATLHPIGSPRELVLNGPRQKLEKNWVLFERASPLGTGGGDGLYAIYSVAPHRTLGFSLAGAGPIEFTDLGAPILNPAGFAQAHGGLRGGAPPQYANGHFYSFCHSIEAGEGGYTYLPSVYRFAAGRPFAPTDMPRCALPIRIPPEGRRALPKLNPAVGHVVYPAGAAWLGGRWVISAGVDDERFAILVLTDEQIAATLAPIG